MAFVLGAGQTTSSSCTRTGMACTAKIFRKTKGRKKTQTKRTTKQKVNSKSKAEKLKKLWWCWPVVCGEAVCWPSRERAGSRRGRNRWPRRQGTRYQGCFCSTGRHCYLIRQTSESEDELVTRCEKAALTFQLIYRNIFLLLEWQLQCKNWNFMGVQSPTRKIIEIALCFAHTEEIRGLG